MGRLGSWTGRGDDLGGFSMRPDNIVGRGLVNARGMRGAGGLVGAFVSIDIARGWVGVFGLASDLTLGEETLALGEETLDASAFGVTGGMVTSFISISGWDSGEARLSSLDLREVEKHARVRMESGFCFCFSTYSLHRGRMTIFSRFASLRI